MKRNIVKTLPIVLLSLSLAACNDEVVPENNSHVHDYQLVSEVSATCYKTGVKSHYICSNPKCATMLFANDENKTPVSIYDLIIAKTAHHYVLTGIRPNTIENPTKITGLLACDNEGCSDNVEGHFSETEATPCTLNTESPSYIAPSCYEGGVGVYDVDLGAYGKQEYIHAVSATGHQFSKEWSSDGTYHWHDPICGHAVEPADKGEHINDEKIVSTATKKSSADCVNNEIHYYSCECGKVSNANTFEIEGTATGHSISEFSISTQPTKKVYDSFDKMDLTGLVVTGTCTNPNCPGVNLGKDDFDIVYQNGSDHFVIGDTKVQILYKKDHEKKLNISGINIEKAHNVVNIEDKTIKCLEQFKTNYITSKFGSIDSVNVVDKNGTPVEDYTEICFDNSPYTVTASVNESTEFSSATGSAHLFVEHDFSEDIECVCNDARSAENIYYELSTKSFFTSDAKGFFADDVKAATSMVAPEVVPDAGTTFVTEVNGNKFEVLVVNEVIETLSEFKTKIQIKDCTQQVTRGYYVLGCDIDGAGFEYVDIPGSTDVSPWAWSGYGANGFRGVFDGRGHTISNFKLAYQGNGGLFTFVGYGGTVKNFNLTHVTAGNLSQGSALCHYAYFANFENINIQYDVLPNYSSSSSSVASKYGYIVGYRAEGGCTFKNVNIDCSGKAIGNAAYANWYHGPDTGANRAIFENCTIKCLSYLNLGEVQGPGSTDHPAATKLPDGLVWVQI